MSGRKKMPCTVNPTGPVRFDVALRTHGQTREKIHEIVDALLTQNRGIIECGLMARFSIELAAGHKHDSGGELTPELEKLGVMSLTTSGAA
jgi:hypothetical protein